MREMTVNEYAQEREILAVGVHKQLRAGRDLPAVVEVKKFGRTYVLVVDEAQLKLLPKGRIYQ